MQWCEEIKEKRKKYGVTQAQIASYAGISQNYYSKLEKGHYISNQSLKDLIDTTLEIFNPDKKLRLLFDYVRIRFPTLEAAVVAEKILHINLSSMIYLDHAFYGYNDQYFYGSIVLMVAYEEKDEMGILLELKGQGCRELESLLEIQGRSWFDFLDCCLDFDGKIKRLDLAIDDTGGVLSIPELAKKCRDDECITCFKSYEALESGEALRGEKDCMGHTLYIGSKSSETYFCLYEKDYEQYKKKGIPIEDAEVKNRFEIRLKNERAEKAIDHMLSYRDPEETAFSIINRYVRFVDRDDNKPRLKWPDSLQWQVFLGDGHDRLKLATNPKKPTYERMLRWIEKQVASSLLFLKAYDEIMGLSNLEDIFARTEINDIQLKILKQASLSMEEVIVQ